LGLRSFWPRLFLATLVGHLVFGGLLGWLAERWARDRGTPLELALLRRAEPATLRTRDEDPGQSAGRGTRAFL